MYAEIFRVLKPGAMFVTYEWVSTAKYNPKNADHVRIIDEINFGNGLPVRSHGGPGRHRAGEAKIGREMCWSPSPLCQQPCPTLLALSILTAHLFLTRKPDLAPAF